MDSYLNWMDLIAAECKRTLKKDGHLFINLGYSNINPWIDQDVANVFRKYFVLQNKIQWVKSIHTDKTQGHFKPVNSKRFITPTNETIYHFTHDGNQPIDRLAIGVEFADKTNIKRFGHDRDKRCKGNSWFIPYDTITSRDKDRGGHPASYPIELVTNCLKLVDRIGLVLDPFMGTGTTAIGAIESGWDYIGFEIDRIYLDYANKRIDNCKNLWSKKIIDMPI